MPTPPKPLLLLKGHISSAEKREREKNEHELLSGAKLKEWPEIRKKPVAHARFTQVRKLLEVIGKDDALFEPVINRYCLILAECSDMESMRKNLACDLTDLMNHQSEMDYTVYISAMNKIEGLILKCDAALQSKRKMLLDIERENGMTLLAQLRYVAKNTKEGVSANDNGMFG